MGKELISSSRRTGHCDEPLNAKIVSAGASTIFKSHLHCAKGLINQLFAQFAGSTFAKWILQTEGGRRWEVEDRGKVKRFYKVVEFG